MTTVIVELPDGWGAVDVASGLVWVGLGDRALVDGVKARDCETTLDVDGRRIHVTIGDDGHLKFRTTPDDH